MLRRPRERPSRSTQIAGPADWSALDASEPDGEPMSIHVYMLRCSDGSYYVGSTRDSLESRIGQHNAGAFGSYTAARRPVTLVWQQEFQQITDVIAAERRLKGWSRSKKEALLRGDYDAVSRLARRRGSFAKVAP